MPKDLIQMTRLARLTCSTKWLDITRIKRGIPIFRYVADSLLSCNPNEIRLLGFYIGNCFHRPFRRCSTFPTIRCFARPDRAWWYCSLHPWWVNKIYVDLLGELKNTSTANPGSFLWLVKDRPAPNDTCADVDRYKYGLTNGFPGYSTGDVKEIGREGVVARYRSRNVHYAQGTVSCFSSASPLHLY
jgi:hypothetical protein